MEKILHKIALCIIGKVCIYTLLTGHRCLLNKIKKSMDRHMRMGVCAMDSHILTLFYYKFEIDIVSNVATTKVVKKPPWP